jgi:GxxExxY protein
VGHCEALRVVSYGIIGAALEVHRALGPGLMESAYEACLAHELTLRGFSFERQRPVPVVYKGVPLDTQYRLDLVVDNLVIVELKAVAELLPIHDAQVLTYLKLTGLDVGLLFNFNTALLRSGMRRIFRPGADAYGARLPRP